MTAFELVNILLEGAAMDPRNGPMRHDYKHADQPDPYQDLSFPARADDMKQFLRGRKKKKKRTAKPIL